MQEKNYVQYSLRVSKEMYNKILKQAEKEKRSINNMLRLLIEEGLEQRKK